MKSVYWGVSLLVLFSSANLYSQDWTIHVVDSAGIRPSLDLDSEGTPHLVYFEYVGGGGAPRFDETLTKYASWDNVSETFQRDTTFVGAVHPFVDLAFSSNDVPHYILHCHCSGDPVHSFRPGSTWTHDPIPSESHDGFCVSIVLDDEDLPHISFVDGAYERDPEAPGVEYAYYDGEEWHVDAIGSERFISHHTGTSIALSPEGVPSIAYYDSVSKNLMLGTRNELYWNIERVDSSGDAGRFPSLQFDSEGFPRISYLAMVSPTTAIVRLAAETDLGWIHQDLDTLYSVYLGDNTDHATGPEGVTSLAVSSTSETYVAYSDQQVVRLATSDDGQITKETIFEVSEGMLGQLASLALDSEDQPHLAFYVDGGDSLGICMYASRTAIGTGISSPQDGGIPGEMFLAQNYPNPFNPATEIGVEIRETGNVSLKVYNLLGQEVATLIDEILEPGYHFRRWDATGFSSGIYLYRMQAGSFVETKKLLLLK